MLIKCRTYSLMIFFFVIQLCSVAEASVFSSLSSIYCSYIRESIDLTLSNSHKYWSRGDADYYGISLVQSSHLSSQKGVRLIGQVQRALIDRGYDPGPIDGVFGVLTENALFFFQMDNELEVTGSVNSATLIELHITPPQWLDI